MSRAGNAGDLAAIPLKFGAGVTPLQVRDVARVTEGAAPRTGAATEDGAEAVLGSVMMPAGENSRVVAHRVGRRLAELQERLPPGIEARVQYDRAEPVDRTIATVVIGGIVRSTLLTLVLLPVLYEWAERFTERLLAGTS